ncbi:hypothetical protein [Bacillus sp. 1P06AnD]|uniref:hypothetical protein n=1 Tax=Bacillus sp. 1P06AnD TaxID=3132208 RepID=UPI00399F8D2B
MKLFLAVCIFLLIGGCSENASTNIDEIDHFPTQEEAIAHFVEVENITGNIDLVTTTKRELLLVSQLKQDIYFVGEVKENTEGYDAVKLSASFKIGFGAAWEFNTMDNEKYTISFEKSNEKPNLIRLSNDEYYISIVEGHTLNRSLFNGTNAIKEARTIKSK